MHPASVRHAIFFCFVCSFCSAVAEDASPEKQAATEFRRFTTNLQYNRDGTVRLIRLSKPLVTDESLAALANFPHLDYLAIIGPQITDGGIVPLRTLTNLDTLLLDETSVTSEGLKTIADLKKLEVLSLASTAIDDDAADTLAQLRQLRTLSLRKTTVGDPTIQRLSTLENLEALFLDDTSVSDACFASLARMENLELLSVSNCSIRGDGFLHLADHPRLAHLVLSGCRLSESSLQQLAKIPSLKTLELYGSGLSPEIIRKIFPPSIAVAYDKMRQVQSLDPAIFDRSDEGFETGHHSVATEPLPPIDRRLTESGSVDFQRHVIPLLGRLGCNGRSCHGSFQGQGGFRLSMFGYDFDEDLQNLRPRVDLEAPAQSLLVNKPTSDSEHEGGKRMEPGSWQQRLLVRWIESGASGVEENASSFQRLEVFPNELIFQEVGQTVPLRVVAVWSDGLREDVTCLTRFETTDDTVATVSDDGLVQSKAAGDAHIIAYYDNGVVPTSTILPVSGFSGEDFPDVPAPTRIDQLVVAKLSKLGIVPSELTSDEEFLRRLSLDMIGTLPTPDEVTRFVADSSPDKRQKKIDQLLEHPAYVAWWTTRLCDLTGSNAGYLGNTEMAQPVAAQWRAWIERRVGDNVGWDQIVADMLTSTSRKDGQSYRDFVARQSEFTRKSGAADYAAPDNPMPHYWFRDNIKIASDKTLSFGYTFMGLRLDCAQCHKHPFDRWSKQDFDSFTEFFTRIKTGLAPDAQPVHDRHREMLGVPVKLNTAALRRQSYMRIAAEGRPIPWREVFVDPPSDRPQPAKFLGSIEIDLSQYNDPRVLLAQWLRSEPNRYLSKAFVNRIWANYFGVGIVNPTDDLNLANPPSNGPLLEYLTDQFIRHRYDMKWLHRTITSSRTYQLSWRPNETNLHDEKHFSHAILRRLPAEVAIDAILQATIADKKMKDAPANVPLRKISQHPKSYQTRSIDYSLLVFGKPLRTTNCDCERQNSPTLPQALYIRNDQEIHQALDRPDGWIAEVSKMPEDQIDCDALVQQAYLRTLSRRPRPDELAIGADYLQAETPKVEGLRDLMWALINTQEFIANH